MTTRGKRRQLLSLALAILAIAVGGAALAWACTPSATISVSGASGQDFGPAGSRATVFGTGFVDGAVVEIHWGSPSGPVLERATGPTFSVAVTIPANAAGGVYYIVATAQDRDGAPRQAPAAFLVGEPAGAPGSGPETGGDSGGGSAGGGAPAGPLTPPGATVGGADAAPGAVSAPEAVGNTTFGGIRYIESGGRRTGAPGSGVTTLPSGQAVFAGSLGSTQPVFAGSLGGGRQEGATAAKPGSLAPSKGAASERTVGGDLWSGFDSAGKAPMARLDDAHGLSGSPGSGPYLGIGLASFGLAALLLGFGVVELRRRRIRA